MDPIECQGHSHEHGDHAGGSDDHLGKSLRKYFDMDKVVVLNEEVKGSGKQVLSKFHEDRLTATPSVQSPEEDAELLFLIPFTEAVTIQSFTIRNGAENSSNTASPKKIKLFVNREQQDLDFESARELKGDLEVELLPPDHFAEGTIDYPVRPAGRFQNIGSIAIFVVNNYDESEACGTEITYIGFKGKGTNMKRQAVETVYEAQGMPKDHKVDASEYGNTSTLGAGSLN